MSSTQWFMVPVFLQMLLIGLVGVATALARVKAVKAGETRLKDIALNNAAWSGAAQKLGNNFNNQFQLPVVYFAFAGLALALNAIDSVLIALGFAFLALRMVHTYIHTGKNEVVPRFKVFLATFGVLFLMWLWLAIHVFLKG